MKYINSVIEGFIPHDVVQVEYKGVRYLASECEVRKIQIMYADKTERGIKVFDIDKNGVEYEMEFREDGKFSNSFTSNIFDLAFDLVFNIL